MRLAADCRCGYAAPEYRSAAAMQRHPAAALPPYVLAAPPRLRLRRRMYLRLHSAAALPPDVLAAPPQVRLRCRMCLRLHSAAASLPDVLATPLGCGFAAGCEAGLHSAAASPPDVRRGSAPPSKSPMRLGYAPGTGFALNNSS